METLSLHFWKEYLWLLFRLIALFGHYCLIGASLSFNLGQFEREDIHSFLTCFDPSAARSSSHRLFLIFRFSRGWLFSLRLFFVEIAAACLILFVQWATKEMRKSCRVFHRFCPSLLLKWIKLLSFSSNFNFQFYVYHQYNI